MATSLSLCWPVTGLSTEYSLDYKVKSRYKYNDNIGLRPNSTIDVHGVKLSLPTELAIRDEQFKAAINCEISSSKYDESGYNSDDQLLRASGNYLLERGAIGGSIGIDRGSTTETEFLDTGVVGATASRVERVKAAGNTNYMLTENNSATASIQYSTTDYDTNRFVNNENILGIVGLAHQMNESTAIRLQGTASRFENDARLEVVSDTIGVQTGFDHTLTERLKVSILAGYTNVETDYSTDSELAAQDDDNTSGWTANGSLSYETQRSTLGATFVRTSRASGDGYLIVSNRLNVNYEYDLSERGELILELTAGSSGALDNRINNDRDYARGKLQLGYRLTQSWAVSAAYTYSYQDRERASGSADSNAIYATLTYHPNAIIWSR